MTHTKNTYTNQQLFEDLKQFITATISQQMSHMATKDDLERVEQRIAKRIDTIESRMATKEDIDTLEEKVDLIQDAIAESFTGANKLTNATLQDHEQRLGMLERSAA